MKASFEYIQEKLAFTERRACGSLLVPASSYRYQPRIIGLRKMGTGHFDERIGLDATSENSRCRRDDFSDSSIS
jgi:hypothetical protein